ncbi:hypothetical protein LCGC14_0994740 [marine sediment metagenome]|uniref:Uncharacterized protein n=1 Tax=marine sediment metagenome TaxID=412755 RepID=A0A0F9RB28_9ZZZZ
MSEVDEMKKTIAEWREFNEALEKKITLAREQIDRTRKEKRGKSNHPN